MKKKISFLVLLVSGLLAISACDNATGNQDLHEINEVDFGGINATYSTIYGEPFTIEPELMFTQDTQVDTSRYEFEWFALVKGNILPGDRRKDLAETKNLDVVITIPPGPYEVFYRVTDKQTGVQWSKSFDLEVASSIYEGWLLMTDVNGEARLGMVSFVDEDVRTIPDVLTFTNSALKLQGAPVDVTTYSYDPQMYGIYVTAEETGTTKIDPESFDWQNSLYVSYEMQGNVPENFGAGFIQPAGGGTSYMYDKGDIYYYFRIFQINYGLPINTVSGEDELFETAPYIATGNGLSNSYPPIIFDETNQRFLQHGYTSGTNVTTLPEGTLFDYNIGKELVYMVANRYNDGQVFAILKDGDGTHYLARMAVSIGSVTQSYYDEMTATDIGQARHFAVSPVYGYIFYNVGSKVYQYDMSAKNSKLMLDKSGQEITYLGFNTAANNKLVVATHDPSAPAESSGTLELYDVPAVRQQITLENSYTGFGKIVDVDYRTR